MDAQLVFCMKVGQIQVFRVSDMPQSGIPHKTVDFVKQELLAQKIGVFLVAPMTITVKQQRVLLQICRSGVSVQEGFYMFLVLQRSKASDSFVFS